MEDDVERFIAVSPWLQKRIIEQLSADQEESCCVHLALDAFDLLDASPALGQSMMTMTPSSRGGAAVFLYDLELGVCRWLRRHMSAKSDDEAWRVGLARCPLRVHLLPLRIPFLYTPSAQALALAASSLVCAHESVDERTNDHVEASCVFLPSTLLLQQPHQKAVQGQLHCPWRRRQHGTHRYDPCSSYSASPATGLSQPCVPCSTAVLAVYNYPLDSHVEHTRHVSVLGVVVGVFFSNHSCDDPVPWIRLELLPDVAGVKRIGTQVSETPSALSNAAKTHSATTCPHSCSSLCMLTLLRSSSTSTTISAVAPAPQFRTRDVDLRHLPRSVWRSVCAVGALVELHASVALRDDIVQSSSCPYSSFLSHRVDSLLAQKRMRSEPEMRCCGTATQRRLVRGRCMGDDESMCGYVDLASEGCTANMSPSHAPEMQGTCAMDYLVAHAAYRVLSMNPLVHRWFGRSDNDSGTIQQAKNQRQQHEEGRRRGRYGEMSLSSAAEETTAIHAIRCWEGARLALGVDSVTETSEAHCLTCTDYFAISLDSVVAQLITLFAAVEITHPSQSSSVLYSTTTTDKDEGTADVDAAWSLNHREGSNHIGCAADISSAGIRADVDDVVVCDEAVSVCGGVSTLLMLDRGLHTIVQHALGRLATVAPTACLCIHADWMSRGRRARYLPSYHAALNITLPFIGTVEQTATHDANDTFGCVDKMSTLNRQQLGSHSYNGVATAADEDQEEGEHTIACSPHVCQEAVCAGVLSRAIGRTLVQHSVECLHDEELRVLQQALLGAPHARTSHLDRAMSDDCNPGSHCNDDELRYRSPQQEQPWQQQSSDTSSAYLVEDVLPSDYSEDAMKDDVHLVRREGGQVLGYQTTQSLLCTLTDPHALLRRGVVFEFARRVDVAVRPSIDVSRSFDSLQMWCAHTDVSRTEDSNSNTSTMHSHTSNSSHRSVDAVCGTLSEHTLQTSVAAVAISRLQTMLCDRVGQWLVLLSRALALPRSAHFAPETPHVSSAPPAMLSNLSDTLASAVHVRTTAAGHSLLHPWHYVMPQLTERCGALLQDYFLAAKAVHGETAEVSMMDTLVRLTRAHAAMRVRLLWHARAAGLSLCDVHDNDMRGGVDSAGQRYDDAHTSANEHAAWSVVQSVLPQDGEGGGAAPTALIDAVVAIGLCDASLHFFGLTSLLGTCVFALLARERAKYASYAGGNTECTHARQSGGSGTKDEEPYFPDAFVADDVSAEAAGDLSRSSVHRRLHFLREVEWTTRLCVHPHEDVCVTSSPDGGFSILEIVRDLERRLKDCVTDSMHGFTA